MPTKLFLRSEALSVDPGEGWTYQRLLHLRGSALQVDDRVTEAGPTSGLKIDFSGGFGGIAWVSEPLKAVTISGDITLNLWMAESNASANVGAHVIIYRCNNAGVAQTVILDSEHGVELPVTTRSARNWSATPTSTVISEGDRIRIDVLGNDVGTMAAGHTFNLGYSGATASADGDSYVEFTETFEEFSDIAVAIQARSEADSFWKLNEPASPYFDSVDAATGTVIGNLTESQTTIVPGTTDPCILFPDTDGGSISFGNVYDFTGSATFTAYCWIKPTTYDSVNANWIWGNRDAAARGWALFVANPACTWTMQRGDNAGFDSVTYLMSEAEYENGLAKQVAMSYDGTNLILNINGVDVAQGASSKSLVAPTTDTNLRFGAYGGGGSAYEGYAQYAAIFSPNLVAADLLAIYESGFPPAGRKIQVVRSNMRW